MKVLLSLGSNQGNRFSYLFKAHSVISNFAKIIQSSAYMKTSAIGPKQRGFINQIILIETQLNSQSLLEKIKSAEKIIGRVKTYHWGPREIDIDILFYEKEIKNTKNLVLPHKEIYNRRFILEGIINLNSKTLKKNLNIIKYFEIKNPNVSMKSLLTQSVAVL